MARLALQAGAAAGLAVLAMRLAGGGEIFLAVISAVLVLQRNRDATLGSAAGRLTGALTGTLAGMLAIFAARPWLPDPGPLVLAMLIMGGIAARWPGLRYGLVAAAGLAVASDQSAFDTAAARSLAIFVGALAGILVGYAVLPESAGTRARRQLGATLELCRRLLDKAVESALRTPSDELSDLHSRFSASIANLRDTVAAPTLRRTPAGKALAQAVHGCERLWHALIILDRVGESGEEGVAVADEIGERLRGVRSDAADALDCLSRLKEVPADDLRRLADSCREAHAGLSGAGRPEQDEEVRQIALIFGLSEVSRNIAEINRAIGAVREAD